jgi:hypothetical protein
MITFPINGKNHLAQILKTFNFKPNKDKEYSADKFSLAANNQHGFIGFHELDIEYIKSIILQIMLDITEVTIIDTETETNTIINLKEQKETMLDLPEYRYQSYFDFRSEHAYKHLNRTLGYQLKNNTDEYICEKYKLSLDYDVGYVYFKELDRTFIKDTMTKIVSALGNDKWYWDVMDEMEYGDIENEASEQGEEELLEFASIPNNILEEAQNAYQEKYNKLISSGWNENVSEFIAVLTKDLYLIDNTNPLYKARQTKEYYAHIYENVKVMLEEPNEKKKKVLSSLLNRMISKTDEIKSDLANTDKEYWVSMIDDFNIILNNADAEIKNTLNTLNASI